MFGIVNTHPRCGSLAQLGEHLPYKQRVIGSSPITPTRKKHDCRRAFFVYFVNKHAIQACLVGDISLSWLTLASKFTFDAI